MAALGFMAVFADLSCMHWTGGFRLVAALGFVAPLAVALVGPLVGQTLDGIPRSAGLRVAVIGQSCLIIAGGAGIWLHIGSRYRLQNSSGESLA